MGGLAARGDCGMAGITLEPEVRGHYHRKGREANGENGQRIVSGL